MTAHDPSLSRRPALGILTWLGFSAPDGPSGDEDATAPATDRATDPGDPARAARHQLMADISGFLAAHDLDITPFTLTIAHDYPQADQQRLAGTDHPR